MLQLIITPKILSQKEIDSRNDVFGLVSLSTSDLKKVYTALYSFFEEPSLNISRVKTYYHSYWQWYVRSVWQLFLSLPEDRVLSHLAIQIPTAFRLNISVENTILSYIYRRCVEEKDMIRFFRQMQTAVTGSSFPLNPIYEKSNTIASVIDKYQKISRKGDTLEISEMYATVQKEVFFGVDDESVLNKEELTKAFLDLLLFIRETNNIADVVLEYVEKKERELDIDFSKESAVAVKSDTEKIVKEKVEPTQVESHSYARIRSMIDARFPKDDAGQYVNIDGVLALLTSLAADYNDPHIAELYVYDEKQNMFMWSEDAV